MNPQSLFWALIWLAALGGAVLIATRVVGKVGARAAAAV